MNLAASVAARARVDSQPRRAAVHLLPNGSGAQLLVVNGSRLYELSDSLLDEFQAALERGHDAPVDELITALGLDAPIAIDDRPLPPPPIHAISLAVAQKCNLGCTYCYAQQGSFGGPARSMSLEVAMQSVDMLLAGKAPGSKVSLAFLGGEPLQNRSVVRATTDYAMRRAADRDIDVRFSITTNGTLLKPSDADFFESHGFAVTVSLDGPAAQHDRLRPLKNGRGSFALIVRQIAPLLARQRNMQVSARVTVTPTGLDLLQTLDQFIGMGFHTVGFSPLLHAPNGQNEMAAGDLEAMLEGMIACGLEFERNVLRGVRYPFLNMVNALRELHRGTHRPYPCGAGAGYLGVSAEGDLAACHRFVGDEAGRFGTTGQGVDAASQIEWLKRRHVHAQSPCSECWARYLCGGGCHHEVLARGRTACDYIRGWLHYVIQAYGRLSHLVPDWQSPE